MKWLVTINVYNIYPNTEQVTVWTRSKTETYEIVAESAGEALDKAEAWMPQAKDPEHWRVQHRGVQAIPDDLLDITTGGF